MTLENNIIIKNKKIKLKFYSKFTKIYIFNIHFFNMTSKILIVDDNELNLKLLQNILKSDNRVILSATSGYDSLLIIDKNTDINLILMDVQMPGLDGFETARLIKKKKLVYDIPIIFITGLSTTKENINIGFEVGVYDFIVKPIDNHLLVNKVNNFIQLHKQKKDIEEKSSQLEKINKHLQIIVKCEDLLLQNLNETELVNEFLEIFTNVLSCCFASYMKLNDSGVIVKKNYPKVFSNNMISTLDVEIEDQVVNLYKNTPKLYGSSANYNIKNDTPFIVEDLKDNRKLFIFYFTHDINLASYLCIAVDIMSYKSELVTSIDEIVKYFNLGMINIFTLEQKKQAEKELEIEKEELSIYLKSIANGVLTVNTLGIIKFVNDSVESILGYKSSELLGKYINDYLKIFDENSTELCFNPFEMLSDENKMNKMQFTIIDKNNIKKIVMITATKILDKDLIFNGVTLVFDDITEKIKSENQSALEQKMISVGQLASGIAHEINTPIQFIGDNNYFIGNSFRTFLEYLKEIEIEISDKNKQVLIDKSNFLNDLKEKYEIDYLNIEVPLAIERMNIGIQRISKLVSAMRSFAHPGFKTKIMSDINQSIEVTLTITKNEWKNIAEIELDLDKELPHVNCVLDEINQVLLNLIINSIYAIKEQKTNNITHIGLIKITTSRENDKIIILISDNGTGIPKEIQNRVFDPFFTTKPVGKGTGQGLAIAHDIIVNKHNGQLFFDSISGSGTQFYIILPIK